MVKCNRKGKAGCKRRKGEQGRSKEIRGGMRGDAEQGWGGLSVVSGTDFYR